MARRSIEMYEYRQALMRLRQGDSEREIARSGLMGRPKAGRLRELARERGWLDGSQPLPSDAEIAAALGAPRLPVSAQSSIAAWQPLIEQWLAQGVSGVAIHAALVREHGFKGHYSSVRRLIATIARDRVPSSITSTHQKMDSACMRSRSLAIRCERVIAARSTNSFNGDNHLRVIATCRCLTWHGRC